MEAATARLGRRRARRRYGAGERRLAAAMLSPALVIIALVAAYPIGYAIWLSLNEYSVRFPDLSRWAGFKNYSDALGSSEFWDAVGITFMFTGISVPLLTPAILVALIFRTLDALRIFDLPFVLTRGSNGTTTLSLLAHQELTTNRLIGLGSALSV